MKGPHSRITYVKRLPRKSSRWCIQAIQSADERLPKQPHKSESTVMLNVSLGYSMQLHISLFYNKELHGNIRLGTCFVLRIAVRYFCW